MTKSINLTQALIKAFDNAGRILPPADLPPAEPPLKAISIDYPHISSQPAYGYSGPS